MRADGRQGDMRKRFAIVIGVAAAGVMALGAQTAAASDVVTYDTKLTIHKDTGKDTGKVWGIVESDVRKCEHWRQVFLFKRRPGTDRKIATDRSRAPGGFSGVAVWQVRARRIHRELVQGDGLRAKVLREVHDEFVCRADRTRLVRWMQRGW